MIGMCLKQLLCGPIITGTVVEERGFVFEASRKTAFRMNRNQRKDTVRHYFPCGSNADEASRRHNEVFHIHAVQCRNIKSFVNKFERTGSVNDASRSGRPATAASDEKGKLTLTFQRRIQK
ncbi:uncharacterized protein LOC118762539 isoform X2 [Octopus sinensis]|uniref:Uncharacterized protein LOC118762539 isoform X2 n=1 Tax=Octopus sinensis TaxID=2607531 RepID=A0A7E6EQR8_9MOLL|nr:uncharacterized protein LOC118762539 isoform X2 [Octopus sinensis]